MLPRKCIHFLFLFAVLVIFDVTATRTKDKIYESIQGAAACFRRMNGTHQFGCASQRSGNVGVLQLVNNSDDLQWLLDKSVLPHYMAVLHLDMFTKPVMLALKKSAKITGVVLLKEPDGSTNTLSHFSHEDTCPNRYSGLSSLENQQCQDSQPWNKDGTALMMVDWGFPIFYVTNQTSINQILKCVSKYNADKEGQDQRSMCAMEMQAFMFAAKDSETCIRRNNIITNLNPVRYCDPLADRNIWSTIFPRSKEEPDKNRSIIMLTARLDSTSLFDGETPGAGSSVVGLVSVLATAKMLAEMRPEMEPLRNGRNVMFALLNGEAYDYIGSSRMVYDMKAGRFPPKAASLPALNLTSLRFLVELNQVTQLNVIKDLPTLVFHATPHSNQPDDEVSTFIRLMQAQGPSSNISFEASVLPNLPPASLQTFSKADPKLPGVVVTDHDDHYVNRFYHSILDDAALFKFTYFNGSEAPPTSVQSHLARLSTALAKTIFEMTTDQPYKGNLAVDATLVDELLQCFLVSMDCRMFRAATQGEKLPSYAHSMYIGVANGPNVITGLTGQTLALLTGTKINVTKSECKTNRTDLTYQYIWMRGSLDATENSSVCMQTTMNYSLAESPAFDITDYKWTSGEYSTWTESIWRGFSVRIFLKPSRSHEAFVLSLGSCVMVLSFVVVWFLARRSDVLFNTNTLNGGC